MKKSENPTPISSLVHINDFLMSEASGTFGTSFNKSSTVFITHTVRVVLLSSGLPHKPCNYRLSIKPQTCNTTNTYMYMYIQAHIEYLCIFQQKSVS